MPFVHVYVDLYAEPLHTDFFMEISNLDWDFGGLDFHADINIHF